MGDVLIRSEDECVDGWMDQDESAEPGEFQPKLSVWRTMTRV